MHHFLYVGLSVPLSVWVSEIYVVHHFTGTELCCAPLNCVNAPPTCFVHQGAQGAPCISFDKYAEVDMGQSTNYVTPKGGSGQVSIVKRQSEF